MEEVSTDRCIKLMSDIVYRSTIGTGGFIATLELTPVNEVLGFLVGISTLVYMTLSAIKVVKDLRKK